MSSKPELRRALRGRMAAVGAEAFTRAGDRVAELVWTVPEIAGARRLLLYASTAGEVPTDRIADEAIARGIEIVYPRCLPEARGMALHRVGARDELLAGGSYGLREPDPGCESVDAGRIDAALLPGLGWDRAGNRLGRGAGYYDRLLARADWRGFRCGLFLAAQEVERIPTDPWDAPLDAVVTEGGVYRTRTDPTETTDRT